MPAARYWVTQCLVCGSKNLEDHEIWFATYQCSNCGYIAAREVAYKKDTREGMLGSRKGRVKLITRIVSHLVVAKVSDIKEFLKMIDHKYILSYLNEANGNGILRIPGGCHNVDEEAYWVAGDSESEALRIICEKYRWEKDTEEQLSKIKDPVY